MTASRSGGVSHPQFRLRVGDIRGFYDVAEDTVEVLASSCFL